MNCQSFKFLRHPERSEGSKCNVTLRSFVGMLHIPPQDDTNENGAILVISIILAFFLSTIGLSLIMWRRAEMKDATAMMLESQSLAIAEAGVRESIYHITKIDPQWTGDSPTDHPIMVGDETVGAYRVSIVDLGDNNRRIEVAGFVPDANSSQYSKSIQLQGTIKGPSSDEVNKIFLYGIFNGGGNENPFDFDGNYNSLPLVTNTLPNPVNHQVRGAISSNTGFAFRNGNRVVVDGTVYTTQPSVTVANWTGAYSTAGPAVTNQEALPLPILNAQARAAYQENAEVVYTTSGSPKVLTGMIDLGDHLTNDGDILVIGDLKIDAVIKGRGFIVSTGNIEITGSLTGLSAGVVVNLIAFGDIIYQKPNNVVVQAGMYAGNQYKILTSGQFNMSRGSVAAGNGFVIDPRAQVSISYDPKLGDPAENPNALGFAFGIGAGGLGGGSEFDLSGGGYWHEVN